MTQDPRTPWHDAGPDEKAAADLLRLFERGAGDAARCPPPEIVQASRAGALPPELQERVSTHVERCVVCRALSEALEDGSVGGLSPDERDRILQRVQSRIRPPARRRISPRIWQLAAAAAGVTLAAAAAVALWQSRTTPAALPAQRAAPDGPRATPPAFRFEMPNVPGGGRVEQLLRDSAPAAERADLAHALEPSRSRDFGEVASRLRTFVRRHPASAAGHFYLGVTELFLFRDAQAVTELEVAERSAKADAYLSRETAWYLALAYARIGEIDKAKARLEALCQGQNARSPRACAGLRELAAPYTVSGAVTDASGAPIVDASVGEYVVRFRPDIIVGFPTRFAGRTDGAGNFSLSGFLSAPAPEVMVRAAKPGYFTAVKRVPIAPSMRVDLTLDPWVHMPLGTVVRGTVERGDAACGDPTELCERFALTVSASGTLEVSVTAPIFEGMDLYVDTPAGEVFGPLPRAPLRLAIPAVAGSTYQIRVLNFTDRPREFELHTRLR